MAQDKGHIAVSELQGVAKWQRERAMAALRELLKRGMAMIDDGDPSGERLYWFPGISSGRDAEVEVEAEDDAIH